MTEKKDTGFFDDEFSVLKSESKATAPEQPKTKEAAPTKFRREIDLQDGSGVQVFEAESEKELADKLVDAQRNATQEIRRLQRARPRPRKQAASEPTTKGFEFVPFTSDEEARLAQELDTSPSRAIETVLERYGIKPDDYHKTRQDVDGILTDRQEEAEAQRFVKAHEKDYLASPRNSQVLLGVLEDENLPVTVENLEYALDRAHSELEQPKKAQETKPATEARIEPAKAPEKPVKKQTGLSSREPAPEPTAADTLDVNEMLSQGVPMQEIRARINASLRRGQPA